MVSVAVIIGIFHGAASSGVATMDGSWRPDSGADVRHAQQSGFMQGLRQIGERRSLRSMDLQAYLPFGEGLGRP